MKHKLIRRVYYADTDAYGVVWHGNYIKWMEMARVELCRELGYDLTKLKQEDILFVVTGINIKYKSPAKIDDEIVVETSVLKISPLKIIFEQIIKNNISQQINTVAEIEIVAVNNQGELYRKLPTNISSAFKEFKECKD